MKNSVEAQEVVTYVRVTSQNQVKAGYSLDLQREELRKYAEENFDHKIINEKICKIIGLE